MQRRLIMLYCAGFVTSWSGVVRYHGICPSRKAGQIFVANHTSMIDLIILEQFHCFAVVGQKHKGWVGAAVCGAGHRGSRPCRVHAGPLPRPHGVTLVQPDRDR